MSERIPQSVAKRIGFRAYLASDGKTPATGKTIAITISKNGGAFTALSSGTSLTFADGDTIEMRGTGMTAGESWTFRLTDNTRSLVIVTYTTTAS